MTPRITPQSNPTNILFIVCSFHPWYSAFSEIPLEVPQKKEQEFYCGISGQQPEHHGVARPEAAQSMPQRFGPCFHGQALLKAIDILQKRRRMRITSSPVRAHGLDGNSAK